MAIWIQSGRERGGGGGAKRFGPVSVRYTSPPDMQFGIKRGGSHTRTPRGRRCRHIQRNSVNNYVLKWDFFALAKQTQKYILI